MNILLLEDFGDRLMLAELTDANADRLYTEALTELVAIQRLAPPAGYPRRSRRACALRAPPRER